MHARTRKPNRRELEESEDLSARYRALVEQNRALYNEVQDLKGSIRVFCRIRWGSAGAGGAAAVLDGWPDQGARLAGWGRRSLESSSCCTTCNPPGQDRRTAGRAALHQPRPRSDLPPAAGAQAAGRDRGQQPQLR
jgi:hypothetical protein